MDDFEAYCEARNRRRTMMVRGFSLLALVSFVFSISSAVVGNLSGLTSQSEQQEQQAQRQQEVTKLRQDHQKKLEEGYLTVLKREPNNLVALDGLAAVRIEAKDWDGAIEPLEKLAKLSPDQSYKVLLENVKKEAKAN
ncbi:MAG: hypothetical protein SFW36_18580 [Leptolyngbyaceae cyanobacterium bins.59]|nr:hypothetical protein [Leptolyngbyaceae cyanobacterium bins.59]